MNQSNINLFKQLTSGKADKNYVLLNCSLQFLRGARIFLEKGVGVVVCNIVLDKELEQKLINNNANLANLPIKRLIRAFLSSKILLTIMDYYHITELKSYYKDDLEKIVESILNGDVKNVKQVVAPMPHELPNFIDERDKFELNFFLEDTENELIQQVINSFLFAQESYKIKVFTTNVGLPTYRTASNDTITSPRHFEAIDVFCFTSSSNASSEV